MSSYQKGWIVEVQRNGWVSFKLHWRERTTTGGWTTKCFAMPRLTDGKPTTRRHAQKKLDDCVKPVNASNGGMTAARNYSFLDLVKHQWTEYQGSRQMRPGTEDAYASMLKNWIEPYFGKMSLEKITPVDVGSFMGSLRTEKLSDKYRKNIYNMLTLIFDVAVQNDLIVTSPVRPKMHRPAVFKREKPVLDQDKGMALLEAVRLVGTAGVGGSSRGMVYMLATATFMLTGMRQGELLGLRRFNVDLEAKTLTKTHVLYRGRLLEGTKNTSGDGKVRQQTLRMSEVLCGVLKAAMDLKKGTSDDAFIFSREDGTPLDPDNFRETVLYPAMTKVGITREKGTHGFHLFRHTAGSLVFKMAGMKAAQEQLGHSNMQTTANIYVHTDTAQRQQSADVLGEQLKGLQLSMEGGA